MKFNSVSLSVLFVLMTFGPFASATSHCILALNGTAALSEIEFFDALAELETRLEAHLRQGHIQNIETYEVIKNEIYRNIQLLESGGLLLSSSLSEIDAAIDQIQIDFLIRTGQRPPATPAVEVYSFQNLPKPEILRANENYVFDIGFGSNSSRMQVVFSDSVMSDFFALISRDPNVQKAAQKLLKAMTRGFIGPDDSNGIKRLRANKNVLEIGALGETGIWRWGAYVHENTLYVVTVIRSGNHGSQGYETALIRAVESARRANGL